MRYSATVLKQGVLLRVTLLQKSFCPCLLLLTKQRLHEMQYFVQSLFREPGKFPNQLFLEHTPRTHQSILRK